MANRVMTSDDNNTWQTAETVLRRNLRKLRIDDTCHHEDILIRRDSARFLIVNCLENGKERIIRSFSIGRSDYTFERAVSEVVSFLLGPEAAPELHYHGVIKSGNKFMARVVVREKTMWLGPHDTAEDAALEYNDVIVELELDRPLNPVTGELKTSRHPRDL